jgi:O-antigen/teichoic acid export membrane protein
VGVRRVIGGFAALGFATVVGQVLGFFLLAIAARRLGPGDLGAFAFAVNLVAYFAIPANFGVTALAIRDVAQQPHRAREIAGEVIVLQIALSIVPYALLVLLAPVLAPDGTARAVIPIVGATFVLDAVALWWLLMGRQRYVQIAFARLAGGVLNIVLVVLFVHRGEGGARNLAWAMLAGFALNTALILAGALRAEGLPRARVPVGALVRRFRAGAPLGVAAVMISIYYSIDSVMLGYMKGTATVGQYAVAYKLPLAILALAALWVSVLLPHAGVLWLDQREALRRQAGMFASIGLVIALPLSVGAVIVGPDLMPALFGEQFRAAGTPFVLLMLAAALVAFTATHGTLVIAVGDERHYAIGVTCGAVLNVVANFVVIPPFGMTGAACATIAAELLVFAYMYERLRRLLGPVKVEWARVARALAATAAMVAVLLLLRDQVGVIAQVALGAAAFVIAALPLGVVRRHELRAVLSSQPVA